MGVEDPAVITCAISGAIANRDQCPAIPYTPAEYAAEARRIVDEGGVHIHIHARSPDGAPSYAVEDFAAIRDAIVGEIGDAAIINFSTGHDRRQRAAARRLPRGVPPRGRRAQHGLAQLRQVLGLAQAVRLQLRVREPVRRDHRAAGGDAPARHQARGTSASTSGTSRHWSRCSTWACSIRRCTPISSWACSVACPRRRATSPRWPTTCRGRRLAVAAAPGDPITGASSGSAARSGR